MEIRVIVEDKFIYIDGVEVQVDPFPKGYEHIKAIQSIDGKTHVLDLDENGSFDNINLQPLIEAHANKIQEIKAEQAKIEQARQDYLVSWDYIRDQRNALLEQSDWTQLPDSPLLGDPAWVSYRQALRDLPNSSGSPQHIVWPTSP